MQVLRAVVGCGSVTAAAARLGYTPSAVSQQVGALEKEAGTALLERVGRGVRPTAAGLLLTEYADAIGRQVAEAETALADLVAGRTGRLTVRYFATAGAALVAPAVARLRAEHPGVQLELKLTGPDDPLPEVKEGRADVALVVGASGVSGASGGHEGVRLVKLLDDPYLAVLPKGTGWPRGGAWSWGNWPRSRGSAASGRGPVSTPSSTRARRRGSGRGSRSRARTT